MSAKALKNLLKSASGSRLNEIVQRAQNMGELTQILKAGLEPALGESLLSANLHEGGELVVICSSSAWAARLRFEHEALLAAARASGYAADSLKVSVSRDHPGGGASPQA